MNRLIVGCDDDVMYPESVNMGLIISLIIINDNVSTLMIRSITVLFTGYLQLRITLNCHYYVRDPVVTLT